MSGSFNIHSELPQPFIPSLFKSLYVYYFALAFVAYLGCWGVYTTFFHPLRGIPGPYAAKFTELWRTRRYALGNWHDNILEIHRKYGPVVRIAPNEVSFVDKDALIKVYGHSTGTKKVCGQYHTRVSF